MNRTNKGGGGTALYIQKHLKFKMVEDMTTAIEGLCECITVHMHGKTEEYFGQLRL